MLGTVVGATSGLLSMRSQSNLHQGVILEKIGVER